MPLRITHGLALVGALRADKGANRIEGVQTGTVALDPPSIAATSRGTVTFTLTGAATGDAIIMLPPSDLEDDLLYVGAAVTAANTVTVYLYNPTAAALDGVSKTWGYVWFRIR